MKTTNLKGKVGRKSYLVTAVAATFLFAGVVSAANAAGVTVYKDDDKYVKVGGRIQLQYHLENPNAVFDPGGSGSESTDEVFFRRLRPYIEGSVHKDWKGKFQFDYGKAEDTNEIAIKDAYMQYKGFKFAKISLGNSNFPFSREFLTSSKYQQLVERTFVGDHDYGTPDRNVNLKVEGHLLENDMLGWQAAVGSASIDPDEDKLDFDTPVNKNSDFNEGWIVGGRVDFHPFGKLKFSQGDFKRTEMKATISLAGFGWWNDDDNNDNTTAGGVDVGAGKPDVDNVTGFEVSGAFRFAGFSIDGEYNFFTAETVDPTFTGGLYQNGETDLENLAIEGGYMVIPDKLEVIGGWQWQEADNYTEEWTRASVGLNYFFKKHDIKLQTTYRFGSDIDGRENRDVDEWFVQAQYVF